MVTHVVDEALRWQADTTAQQATPDRHNSTINTHSLTHFTHSRENNYRLVQNTLDYSHFQPSSRRKVA